ncbi:MAG: 4-hydroxy-tetrahydrodipicolinate synthase [Clostridia bacterium]|nr:4-hydroxy-tetrahydrodipicolinate synthase [Clostridia bacterium]
MKFIFKGIIPALITPLTSEEKVNEKALREFINYQIEGGVHGIFIVGSTGEAYALNDVQRRRAIGITVDEVKGRIPVIAGTGAITTKDSIQLTQMAESCGVDALSVLTPMFINPNQKELEKHFMDIAKSTSLPVLLYNNLPKTGVTITPETAERLADVENIVGIKDSTGDMTISGEYIRRTTEKDFYVLMGRDNLIHAGLCYGAVGSIVACGNIAPRLCVDIYEKYMAGDIKGSLEAQYKIAPLRMAFTLGSFPSVVKEALKIIGIDAGPCAAPIGPISDSAREKLKEVLKQMELI